MRGDEVWLAFETTEVDGELKELLGQWTTGSKKFDIPIRSFFSSKYVFCGQTGLSVDN